MLSLPCLLLRLCALSILLLCAAPLWAQNSSIGAPIISNFDPKIYKAHSQNWVAVQDQRGVMYFGNSNGVVEYDGQRWKRIPTPGDAIVRSLAIAPDGTVFYGSIADFGYLSANASGKVVAISLKQSIPKDEPVFNDVWQVASTSQGVYFLTRSRIFRFHQGKLSALAGKFASSQATVLNDTLFYTDIEKGISLIDGDEIVPIPQLAGIANGKRIVLTNYGQHTILLGRLSGDFRTVDLSTLWDDTRKKYQISSTATVLSKPFPTEIDHLLNEDHLYFYKAVALDHGRFVISTVRAGVLVIGANGKIERAINKTGGLLDNTVAGIMLDRANNLWAATNSGISHIELSVPQSVFGSRNGIEGISITAAVHKENFYVGAFQNMLLQAPFQYSIKNDMPHFAPLKEGTSEIWQMMEMGGDLMAATGRGLYRIDGDHAQRITGSSNNAYCLGRSPRWPDHLFVGLMGGVEVFQRQAGEAGAAAQWQLVGRLDGIKENVRRISTDSEGELWLSTEVTGLIRAHFNGAKPTDIVTHRIGLEHGLPDLTSVRTATIDGALYLVTPKGLFLAKIAPWQSGANDASRFSPEPKFGKMFADGSLEIKEITSDQNGGALIKTSEGVVWAKALPDGSFQANANPFRGLTSEDDALFVHPDGSVWLPGESLYRVDLHQKKNYALPFSTLLRHLSVNGKTPIFEGTHASVGTSIAGVASHFQAAQEKTLLQQLPYEQNALSFEYSATFYEKPGSTLFQYQLVGFDPDWSEWSNATAKEYTNIPEGKYRFRVRAKNLYGTQGDEAMYAFTILPPWYRTWWAYVLWLALSGVGLFGGVHLYTLRLKREKNHLEELVAERTQQLRDATLTDPLTGLRNRRFIAEVLQNDIVAFVGYKNYVINSLNHREGFEGNEVFGMFLLDMDHFKHVNDTYGHDAGDHVLKHFAEILTAAVRKEDVVVRLGGEEFLVVLKKTKPHYIHTFAKKLLEKVAAAEFDLGDGTIIHKTCSIGYANFPLYAEHPDLVSFEQSVMVADIAMYHAKHSGRNQAVYLEEGKNLPEGEEIIRKAVTNLEFAIKEGYLKVGQVQRPE